VTSVNDSYLLRLPTHGPGHNRSVMKVGSRAFPRIGEPCAPRRSDVAGRSEQRSTLWPGRWAASWRNRGCRQARCVGHSKGQKFDPSPDRPSCGAVACSWPTSSLGYS